MSERIDDLAQTVAKRPSRRAALLGLGALALGALGVRGLGQEAEAKQTHTCNACKNKCENNNKKKGHNNKKNCTHKCHKKCKH